VKTLFSLLPVVVLISFSAPAQRTTFQDSLLDHMIGTWVLQGTVAGAATTHDVIVEWVLAHQYVQIRETSREKNTKGEAAYDAIIFIGGDQPSGGYACLWLDVTGGGGLSAQAIGHAKRNGDMLPFLFNVGGSIFHTTFVYGRNTDTWQWVMDGEEKEKLQPFARLKMTRE
jgi:hypothetical protein